MQIRRILNRMTHKTSNCKKKEIPTNDVLYHFLSGSGRNYERRCIQDIWDFSFTQLERCHNYIQWIFPLKEISRFNASAPVVSDEAMYISETIQENMLKSLDVMLHFYGLKRCGNEIVCDEHYAERKSIWISKNNHNYLRITRILKSLKLFGFDKEAQMFFVRLNSIYLENMDIIGEKTFLFWKEAILK